MARKLSLHHYHHHHQVCGWACAVECGRLKFLVCVYDDPMFVFLFRSGYSSVSFVWVRVGVGVGVTVRVEGLFLGITTPTASLRPC